MKSQSCSGRALANGVAENALLQTVVSFVLESRPGIELKSARRLLYARKKSASFSYVFFLQNRRTRCFCVVSVTPSCIFRVPRIALSWKNCPEAVGDSFR